jgi:hypothetical protein
MHRRRGALWKINSRAINVEALATNLANLAKSAMSANGPRLLSGIANAVHPCQTSRFGKVGL